MENIHLYELVGVFVGVFLLASRSTGRLSPRVFFAPLVFLATRKPVLITWALGSIGMLVMIFASAHANGKDPSDHLGALAAVCLLCGGGVSALTVGPVFMLLRAGAPKPVVELEPGERLVEELAASHFLGGEARGGKLLLTDRRVAFRPHRFNVQLDTWSARLAAVTDVRVSGMRMLIIDTDDGAEAWLIVMSPVEAKSKIEGRRARAELVAAS